ncbi:MAG TPA: hypothetical protein VEJ39_05870 [Candidatus Acidoferrales bacterium]|nr:hypothetical protein [Candidatus Acidoferrales bacterium]
MRIASVGHAVFAATMIALGILGLVKGNFTPVWDPVPTGAPARELLIYLSAFISLATGIGLLWQQTAAIAARVLLAFLLLWFLLFRLPYIFLESGVETAWSASEAAVMLAASWVLYVWFATGWDKLRLRFATGNNGLRIARLLYGLGFIFFGVSHFLYLQNTISLVPGWLPWHGFWARFTGAALVLAGVSVLIGVFARLAAALSAFELGMFTLLVWVPIVAAGSKDAFQWSETIVSVALTAAAWVVADSYRGVPWLAVNQR